MKSAFSIALPLILFVLAAPAAPASMQQHESFSGSSGPGGRWDGVLARPVLKKPEPLWSLRTGMRKGIIDQALDEEIAGGPDAAVLGSGFFAEWTGLLAEFRESYALAEPDRVAGLAAGKPLLIIPSGGLAGSSSQFFRSGLAEYVRSGGIILCFTQQRGSDYAALPVPDGATLEAAGWAEDAGPLYRSSVAQTLHPVLAGLRRPVPAVETDGYLLAYPPSARVLLARQDGLPTLILYPYGSGWVMVTTLLSDRSFGQGLLEQEEKSLVRDLVLWAKSGGRMAELTPGKQYESTLTIKGTEHGESAAVRLTVVGPQQNKPLHERTVPLALKSDQEASLPFRYEVPATVPFGIYHVEYTLLDAKNRQLTQAAESGSWFAVMPQQAPPAQVARAQQPFTGPVVGLSIMPFIERSGDRARIDLAVTRTSGTAGGREFTLRIAEHERPFTMAQDLTTVSIEVPTVMVGKRLAYAVYDWSGRSLARGIAPAGSPQKTGVVVDRPWYTPGQKIKISVTGMGLGAFTLTGLGHVVREHISKDRTFEVPVPQSLPAGTYPLAWEFETRAGARQEGMVPVLVGGTQVLCSSVSLTRRSGEKDTPLTATLRLSADRALQATVKVWPASPSGRVLPGGEQTVSLAAGDQEVPVSFPFLPEEAGIWSLQYSLAARLPEGPGFTSEPLRLDAGRILFDVGTAAVLSLRTHRPLYYEASGPVEITAAMYGSGPAKIELALDNKRLRREKTQSPGTAIFSAPIEDLAPGLHVIRATVSGDGAESVRELRFLYGARLPDLAVTIKTAELSAPVLEVGVGVMNQGRAGAGATEAAVYDGDPARGGKLIGKAAIPPLAPGKQHVFVAKWPLAGMAGQHTLVAAVDRDAGIIEASRSNNTAQTALKIPELLLTLLPVKAAVRADEQARYQIRLINFTDATMKTLSLDLQTVDPAGKTAATDTLSLTDLAPGDVRTIERELNATVPQEGIYLVNAVAAADKPIESDSLGISILPTLLLRGSLEGTPPLAATCRPFTFRYHAKNAGNVQPTNGSLKVEVRSADQKQLVYTQQLPFSLDAGAHTTDRIEASRGDYQVVFRASAVNQPRGLTADFQLAQQNLRIEGPVDVKRSSAPLPRVLFWSGSDDSTHIERAFTDALQKEAFAGESIYLRTVTSAADFTNYALTGLYNVYVLLDVDDAPDTAEVLRNGIAKGRGIVLAGSGERSRSLAEALDFRFDAPLAGKSGSITFPADSVLGITGTLPVSGRVLPPRKKGSRTVATLTDGRPAILFDVQAAGRMIVMPFPLAQSAKSAGTTHLYSLLLRSSVSAVAPEQEAAGSISSQQLLVSSRTGTKEKVRIAETLPPGAKVIWSNIPHKLKDGTLSFDLTAGEEPEKIFYLFQPAEPVAAKTVTEVFAECGGNMVSQGKIE